MNKLKGSLAAKIVAIILLAASCLALTGAIVGIAWLDDYGAYRSTSGASVREQLIDNELENQAYPLLNSLIHHKTVRELRGVSGGARFELLDAEMNVLTGNLGTEEQVERSWTLVVNRFEDGVYYVSDDELLGSVNKQDWFEAQDAVPPENVDGTFGEASPEPTPHPLPQTEQEQKTPEGTKVVYLRMSWTDRSENGSLGAELRVFEMLCPYRYELIGAAVASFLLAVLLFVFLMAAAGHHDASGEVKAGFVEKIPADLLWLIGIGGICALIAVTGNVFSDNYLVASLVTTALCLLGAGLLLLLALMSTAVRLKLGTFLSSCLIWRILRWIWKWIKAAFAAFGKLLRGVPLVWKWIPPFLLLFFLDFAYTMHFRRDGDMLSLGLIFKGLLAAAAILYLALAFRRLRDGAKAIAGGEEQVTVDRKYLVGDLKEHAEDLNHIRDGLSRAVDERMKSERLRTELITNVSHDIKTPLTSIVNYVDLLAREEPENEKTKEYVEVLQRQSARLKKLTDDLVEASKASTGNLPVAAERLELGVLLDQTAGEYGERLTEKNLDLRVTKPEEPVYVQADPRHLWRILDNLMNNIFKYAQPGTRVYLDLKRENGKAALSFRNISAQELNIKAEELTERFVRGDSARSTEGSGLGLAIAASLAKLQNIDLDLSVDGDLFKVILRFDEA